LRAKGASTRTERIARILLATSRILRAPEKILARSGECLAAVSVPCILEYVEHGVETEERRKRHLHVGVR
jgi:hypothetical protein